MFNVTEFCLMKDTNLETLLYHDRLLMYSIPYVENKTWLAQFESTIGLEFVW